MEQLPPEFSQEHISEKYYDDLMIILCNEPDLTKNIQQHYKISSLRYLPKDELPNVLFRILRLKR